MDFFCPKIIERYAHFSIAVKIKFFQNYLKKCVQNLRVLKKLKKVSKNSRKCVGNS